MSKTKKLVILALLMAINVVLNGYYIPVTDALRVTFAYIVMMIVGILFDLKTSLLYGFVEDIVAFIVFPSGSFFPGYTISSIFSMGVYSFFLYDKEVNLKNIAISRSIVSIVNNIILNSLWNTILLSKGFIYYISASIPKNLVMLPIEIIIFFSLYKLLKPILLKIKKSS